MLLTPWIFFSFANFMYLKSCVVVNASDNACSPVLRFRSFGSKNYMIANRKTVSSQTTIPSTVELVTGVTCNTEIETDTAKRAIIGEYL